MVGDRGMAGDCGGVVICMVRPGVVWCEETSERGDEGSGGGVVSSSDRWNGACWNSSSVDGRGCVPRKDGMGVRVGSWKGGRLNGARSPASSLSSSSAWSEIN